MLILARLSVRFSGLIVCVCVSVRELVQRSGGWVDLCAHRIFERRTRLLFL
jgi:hypothetical protein